MPVSTVKNVTEAHLVLAHAAHDRLLDDRALYLPTCTDTPIALPASDAAGGR